MEKDTKSHTPRRFSLKWWESFSGIATVISTIIAIIALFITISLLPKKAPDSALPHTPDLGLEFWQDDTKAPMDTIFSKPGDIITRVKVTMKSRPFDIRFPALTKNQDLKIAAWKNASIQNIKAETNTTDLDAPNFDASSIFTSGKGHVDSEQSSGILFLDKDTFSDFGGKRVQTIANNRNQVSITNFDDPSVLPPLKEMPQYVYKPTPETLQSLQTWKKDIYLVAWIDDNNDGIINSGEYEYILLDFPD